MQVNDFATASALVQPVYILCDQCFHAALLFQGGERMVGYIGLGVAYTRPAAQ
jgi:1,4-dihydroxy-2-naphthoate octaprenyltransferase